MPVTAKLSRNFYERFGDEIADEFVNWFNAVDTTYQDQLKELNESNWQRFRVELHATVAQSEARLNERSSQKFTEMNERFSEKFTEMMKWMFIYWTGTVLSLGGLMIALLRR